MLLFEVYKFGKSLFKLVGGLLLFSVSLNFVFLIGVIGFMISFIGSLIFVVVIFGVFVLLNKIFLNFRYF